MRQLLCHPEQQALVQGFRAVCPVCGSFWDLEACVNHVEYTDAYPLERKHFDPQVGNLKVSTLKRWLSSLELDPHGHVVCEVGFGGGFCLTYLQGCAQEVFGVEAVPANLAHAHSLGVPSSHLFSFHERPPLLPCRVSLWLFLDSFEHILEPLRFLEWVEANSSQRAVLLIVAPNAASLSQRLMGKLWPHRLADHLFHWSENGLEGMLGKFGVRLKQRFNPLKHVSTDMVLNHLALMPAFRPASRLLKRLPRMSLWLNIGEMGLLFEGA